MKTATLDDRFKAFIIDQFFWLIVGFVGYSTADIVGNGIVTVGFISLLYLLKDITGQSPGKRIVGIKIVRKTDQARPNPVALIVRTSFYFVSLFDIPFLIFRKDNRRLADLVFGTVVVKATSRHAVK